MAAPLPFRFLLITPPVLPELPQLAPQLAGAGLKALQIRLKGIKSEGARSLAQATLQALQPLPSRPLLLWNGQPNTALALQLDGAHLPSHLLPKRGDQPLALPPHPFLVGASAHTLEQLAQAHLAGVAYAVYGPVFPPLSKKGAEATLGLEGLAKAAKKSPLPLLALGGITPQNAADCLAAGAWGVAAIGAVFQTPNPAKALEPFQKALGGL